MLNKLLISLVLLLLIGFVAASSALAEFKKTKIAVLDFQQQGKFDTDDIGKMAAEWLTTSLVETGRFDIIERRLLEKIINEQSISNSGLVDESSASAIGKLLGVKVVVTGTMITMEDFTEINARLISVETGSIIVAEKIRTRARSQISELMTQVAEKINLAFPLEGYIVQRTGDRVVIDLGKQAGVKSGMRCAIFREGKKITHPKTGEILDVETIELGEVVLKEVKLKTAIGNIIREVPSEPVAYGHMIRVLLNPEERQAAEEAEKKRLEQERQNARRLADKESEKRRLELESQNARRQREQQEILEREEIARQRAKALEESVERVNEQAVKKRHVPLPSF